MKLSDRCTKPRQVYLQQEQRQFLLRCLRIAAEDGSIYGDDWEDEQKASRLLGDLRFKLKD